MFMWLLGFSLLQSTDRACLYLCGDFCLGTFSLFSGLCVKSMYHFSIKGYSEERGSACCEVSDLVTAAKISPSHFFLEDVKLKRALDILRLSIISVKNLLSMPSKNILGTTKISSSSCLFLLLFVLVYRQFREAPCCADYLGKARGFSPQCCPVGTSSLRWTCLRWARFSPVLLITRTVLSGQLLLAHLLHHFIT